MPESDGPDASHRPVPSRSRDGQSRGCDERPGQGPERQQTSAPHLRLTGRRRSVGCSICPRRPAA